MVTARWSLYDGHSTDDYFACVLYDDFFTDGYYEEGYFTSFPDGFFPNGFS